MLYMAKTYGNNSRQVLLSIIRQDNEAIASIQLALESFFAYARLVRDACKIHTIVKLISTPSPTGSFEKYSTIITAIFPGQQLQQTYRSHRKFTTIKWTKRSFKLKAQTAKETADDIIDRSASMVRQAIASALTPNNIAPAFAYLYSLLVEWTLAPDWEGAAEILGPENTETVQAIEEAKKHQLRQVGILCSLEHSLEH